MLLILEIAMLFGGAYSLFTGKVPQFLVGGKGDYKLEGAIARLIGLVLVAMAIIAFLTMMAGVTGSLDSLVSLLIEAGIIIAVMAIAWLWIKSARQPAGAPASDMSGPGPGATGAGR